MACSKPEDPEAALAQAGVSSSSQAVHWLSPQQHAGVTALLSSMEGALHAWEPTHWHLTDCLLRARRANARTPRQAARSP